MAQVFISHSSDDNDFARFIADRLIEEDFDVWVDLSGIRAGDDWLEKLESALESSAAFVLIWSRAARASDWVKNETLTALNRKMPLHIFRIESIPLALHIVNRQYIDSGDDPERAVKKLAVALRKSLNKSTPPRKRTLAPSPDRDNFFIYMDQLPGGEQVRLIARDLFDWSKRNGDSVEFGGEITPGFSVKVRLGESDVTVFSVRAYPQRPAVQIPFMHWLSHPPYDDTRLRRSTLLSLNRLMGDTPFIPDQADRAPTIPLINLDRAEDIEHFKQIMAEAIDNLRGV